MTTLHDKLKMMPDLRGVAHCSYDPIAWRRIKQISSAIANEEMRRHVELYLQECSNARH